MHRSSGLVVEPGSNTELHRPFENTRSVGTKRSAGAQHRETGSANKKDNVALLLSPTEPTEKELHLAKLTTDMRKLCALYMGYGLLRALQFGAVVAVWTKLLKNLTEFQDKQLSLRKQCTRAQMVQDSYCNRKVFI